MNHLKLFENFSILSLPDNVLRDTNGEPLMVFTGQTIKHDDYAIRAMHGGRSGSHGVYLTPSYSEARGYANSRNAGNEPIVHCGYLKTNKWFDYSDLSKEMMDYSGKERTKLFTDLCAAVMLDKQWDASADMFAMMGENVYNVYQQHGYDTLVMVGEHLVRGNQNEIVVLGSFKQQFIPVETAHPSEPDRYKSLDWRTGKYV